MSVQRLQETHSGIKLGKELGMGGGILSFPRSLWDFLNLDPRCCVRLSLSRRGALVVFSACRPGDCDNSASLL